MKTKEMSKSQLLRNLAIPAYDTRHFAAIQQSLRVAAERVENYHADNTRHFAAIQQSLRVLADAGNYHADNTRHFAAIQQSLRVAAERVENYHADNTRHFAAIQQSLRVLADAGNYHVEIHKRVRADIDRFSKSLVDFSRLNAGTVKLLEVLPPDSRQATFPYPPLIGGPTEGILNQREPLNEPSTDLTPAVTDDVFVKKVFLVTGSDEAANQPVARFIEKLGFKVIILDERPDQGQTRIEKFEDCRDNADFAVILLTPDDIGKSKDEQGKPKFRPSQDSIFGLAACMTQHGRDRICCLYKGELELPSTTDGIILIPMDPHSGWELKLVREMKAAGLPIKLKKVI